MVEDVNIADPSETGSPAGKKSFLSSPAGRIVLVAVLVIALLAIAAVAYFALSGQSEATTPEPTVTTSAGTEASGETPEENVDPEEPEEIPLTDVFTFRDVFSPTIKEVKSAETTSSTGGTTGSTTASGTSSTDASSTTQGQVGDNTLFLEDIITVNGEEVAVLTFNGVTYQAAEGDQLGDTPWQVLEINENSVVMLFGDTRVTLSVGQGLTK